MKENIWELNSSWPRWNVQKDTKVLMDKGSVGPEIYFQMKADIKTWNKNINPNYVEGKAIVIVLRL